jgi:hypothetical protein
MRLYSLHHNFPSCPCGFSAGTVAVRVTVVVTVLPSSAITVDSCSAVTDMEPPTGALLVVRPCNGFSSISEGSEATGIMSSSMAVGSGGLAGEATLTVALTGVVGLVALLLASSVICMQANASLPQH